MVLLSMPLSIETIPFPIPKLMDSAGTCCYVSMIRVHSGSIDLAVSRMRFEASSYRRPFSWPDSVLTSFAPVHKQDGAPDRLIKAPVGALVIPLVSYRIKLKWNWQLDPVRMLVSTLFWSSQDSFWQTTTTCHAPVPALTHQPA
jgi:hypothetical protein